MTKPMRLFDKKRAKEFDQSIKLAFQVLKTDFRTPRDKPLTAEERRELRAEQQRQRRASKAQETALL